MATFSRVKAQRVAGACQWVRKVISKRGNNIGWALFSIERCGGLRFTSELRNKPKR